MQLDTKGIGFHHHDRGSRTLTLSMFFSHFILSRNWKSRTQASYQTNINKTDKSIKDKQALAYSRIIPHRHMDDRCLAFTPIIVQAVVAMQKAPL